MTNLLDTNGYPRRCKSLLACLAVLLLLTGCGGGDSSESTFEAPVGLWVGKQLETGLPDRDLFGMVSPSGQTIIILGLLPFPSNSLYTTCCLSTDNSSGDIDSGLTLVPNGSLTKHYDMQGNYQPRTTLSATLTALSTTPRTMELLWDSRTDISASLNKIADTWTEILSGTTVSTITISASGQLSGNDSSGCIYDGQVFVPTPNVNVYRINMDVSGCFSPPEQFTGNAALDTSTSPDTLVMGTVGFSLFGYTKIGVLERQ